MALKCGFNKDPLQFRTSQLIFIIFRANTMLSFHRAAVANAYDVCFPFWKCNYVYDFHLFKFVCFFVNLPLEAMQGGHFQVFAGNAPALCLESKINKSGYDPRVVNKYFPSDFPRDGESHGIRLRKSSFKTVLCRKVVTGKYLFITTDRTWACLLLTAFA